MKSLISSFLIFFSTMIVAQNTCTTSGTCGSVPGAQACCQGYDCISNQCVQSQS